MRVKKSCLTDDNSEVIKIQKTINKTLVPVNFIKGLAILYTFIVVVGMVGIVESKALLVYFGTQSVIQALLAGYGYLGSVLVSILIGIIIANPGAPASVIWTLFVIAVGSIPIWGWILIAAVASLQ